MTPLKADRLRFKSLEIAGRESISTGLTDGQAFGIYAYEFTDGMRYVGKSTDVRKRHVDHMHEYRYEKPPRKPKCILWAQVDGDERQPVVWRSFLCLAIENASPTKARRLPHCVGKIENVYNFNDI